MATFTVGKALVTTAPSVEVDAGLSAGQHRFQLVVLTDTGQKSAPSIMTIEVRERIIITRPSPVILSPDVLSREVVTLPTIPRTPTTVPLVAPVQPAVSDEPASLAVPSKPARNRTTKKVVSDKPEPLAAQSKRTRRKARKKKGVTR